MNRAIGNDIASRIGVKATSTANAITTAPGAYLILIQLTDSVSLPIPTLPINELPAGHYLYAGSARGPGGLRARIGRHLRRGKRLHWHVDHLTETAMSLLAFPIPDRDECMLVRSLRDSGYYHPPAPGFGSSDCRNCTSHLLEAHEAAIGGTKCR